MAIGISLISGKNKDSIDIKFIGLKPDPSYLIKIDDDKEFELQGDAPLFNWRIHGNHLSNSNIIKLFKTRSDDLPIELGMLEVLRTTSTDYKNAFNTETQNGSIVIGRCTFDLISEKVKRIERLDYLTKEERDYLRNKFSSELLEDNVPFCDDKTILLRKLEYALKALYLNLNTKTGPCQILDGVVKPSVILELIAEKEATLQCAGTRDIFMDILLSCGVININNIRKIDLLRYEPIYKITVNSHAILEFSVDGVEWFLFDPFARIYFSNNANQLLSSSDIRQLRLENRLEEIRVHEIETIAAPYDKSVLLDTDMYNYNYWCHFNKIDIINISLTKGDRELLSLTSSLKKEGIESFALYGGGLHTCRLLSIKDLSTNITCVIDDYSYDYFIEGVPVISPERFSNYDCGAIIISSDTIENELYECAKRHFTDNIKIYKLYD